MLQTCEIHLPNGVAVVAVGSEADSAEASRLAYEHLVAATKELMKATEPTTASAR